MTEQKRRSLIKTVTYRILIILSTATITWVLTKRTDLTLGITSITAVVNTILYYLNERVWSDISWGKRK